MSSVGKIKVVEIIADSEPGGGPAHVLGLLKALDKEKFEPFLICPKGFLAEEAKKITGVKVMTVPMSSKFDIVSIFEIKQALDQIKAGHDPFGPMLVHIHGVRAGFLARLAVPKDIYSIYTEHRYDGDYRLNNPVNQIIQKMTLRLMNRKSHLIIAVSSSVKRFLIDHGLARPEQVVLIPNAIELGTSNPTSPSGLRGAGEQPFDFSQGRQGSGKKIREQNKAPIIGNIGNLNIQKGQIYLIDAMVEVLKKYPSATLEIIGEGALCASLKSKVKSLKLERHITFLGKQANVNKYMKHWDVFVLPSVAETFGISILESMKAGIPVVASKVGGIPDIIDNHKNGLLVKSRDSKALGKAIVDILDHPAQAAKFKREGLKRVADFNWKKVINDIEKVYETPFNKVKD